MIIMEVNQNLIELNTRNLVTCRQQYKNYMYMIADNK